MARRLAERKTACWLKCPDQRQCVTSLKGALEGGRVAGLWLAVE
jgi:hypothetical protein